jgi:hypothetical protein
MGCQFLFNGDNGNNGSGDDIGDNFDDINPVQ